MSNLHPYSGVVEPSGPSILEDLSARLHDLDADTSEHLSFILRRQAQMKREAAKEATEAATAKLAETMERPGLGAIKAQGGGRRRRPATTPGSPVTPPPSLPHEVRVRVALTNPLQAQPGHEPESDDVDQVDEPSVDSLRCGITKVLGHLGSGRQIIKRVACHRPACPKCRHKWEEELVERTTRHLVDASGGAPITKVTVHPGKMFENVQKQINRAGGGYHWMLTPEGQKTVYTPVHLPRWPQVPADRIADDVAATAAAVPAHVPRGTQRQNASKGWTKPPREEAVFSDEGSLSVPVEEAYAAAEAVGLPAVPLTTGDGAFDMGVVTAEIRRSMPYRRWLAMVGWHADERDALREVLDRQRRRYAAERRARTG